MLMHYLECLAMEIKFFLGSMACWIVAYSLANYFGFRGALGVDLGLFLPFMFVYILYNAYTHFVDGCAGCDGLE